MTTPNAVVPPTETPTPAAAPGLTAPANGSPAPAPEYRFAAGPNVPDWAVGRTAQEVLGAAAQMHQVIQGGQQAQPQNPAPQSNGNQHPSDDDYLRTPHLATMRTATDIANAAVNQAFAPLADQFAATSRALAQQQYADDFKRWGPEIDVYMARIPKAQQTIDIYKGAVNLVRGEHQAELIQEAAQKMVAQGGMSERANGGFGAPSPQNTGVDFGKLPGGIEEKAKQHGLTVSMVQDFCKANNMTTAQWMEQATNQKVLSSVAPFSFQLNEDQLGSNRQFS